MKSIIPFPIRGAVLNDGRIVNVITIFADRNYVITDSEFDNQLSHDNIKLMFSRKVPIRRTEYKHKNLLE